MQDKQPCNSVVRMHGDTILKHSVQATNMCYIQDYAQQVTSDNIVQLSGQAAGMA